MRKVPLRKHLAIYDQLVTERDDLDRRRVKEIEQVRTLLRQAWQDRDTLMAALKDVLPDLFPDQQAKIEALIKRIGGIPG